MQATDFGIKVARTRARNHQSQEPGHSPEMMHELEVPKARSPQTLRRYALLGSVVSGVLRVPGTFRTRCLQGRLEQPQVKHKFRHGILQFCLFLSVMRDSDLFPCSWLRWC